MTVRKIEFGFDNDSLFGTTLDVSLIDVEASAEKFYRICRNELQREYPDAEIVIAYHYDPDKDELLSMALPLTIDGDPYSDEAGNANAIVERIHGEGTWTLQKHLLEIPDASNRFGIPRSLLHWMCEHKVFSGARMVRGVWKLIPQELSDFLRQHRHDDHGFQVLRASRPTGDSWKITFSSDTTLQAQIDELGFDTIVVQQTETVHPVFTDRNSRFVVAVNTSQLTVSVEHFYDEDSWFHPKWKREAYLLELLEQARGLRLSCGNNRPDDSIADRFTTFWIDFTHGYDARHTLIEVIHQELEVLDRLIQDTEIVLAGGRTWKPEYESNERLFCLELLLPLLKQLGFSDVHYRGGPKEYGKDFTFSEQVVFGGYRYYGLQAKDGDMSGRVNSAIDEILGQLDDAFEMPYKEGESKEDRYISHFIVAISGFYKDNALDKIREKIPKRWRPMVTFWDKTKIQELCRKAWLQGTRQTT